MIRQSRSILRCLPLLLLSSISLRGSDEFSQAFRNPPDSAQPGVYWYWVGGNVSREGITRDLEAMAALGIKRAFATPIDLGEEGRGPVRALSDEWWSLMAHAITEASRTGIDIGVFNSPGWSQSGGPWIKSAQSMRSLSISETAVSGPADFQAALPSPSSDFQDVAVLALPADKESGRSLRSLGVEVRTDLAPDGASLIDGQADTFLPLPLETGKTPTVDLVFPESIVARSIELIPAEADLKMQCELLAKNADGTFRTIRKFPVECTLRTRLGPMRFAPITISLPPTEGQAFRLIFTEITPGKVAVPPPGLAEIRISPAPRLERYVEKQLGKSLISNQPPWTQSQWPAQDEAPDGFAEPGAVIDLTSKMSPDGLLHWQVPEGDWTILRIGMAPTNVQNVAAPPEATGLEVDKMNRPAVEFHFRSYLGRLRDLLPGDKAKAWKYVIADSYEVGPQNWTDDLQRDFAKRYGYDPLPWLPTLTGRIIGSANQSNRFLWDLRRLVADRFADDYVLPLRELANENGQQLWLENYGHVGFPGEFLQYGGRADLAAGEFWTGGYLGQVEARAASSAGHIYDKPIIPAEAFTSRQLWSGTPWSFKLRGDWATGEGINQFILHYYIQQSFVDRVPGVNHRFGSEFNRNNTWFPKMSSWIDYLKRTHGVLQQGRSVADVLFFVGEDTPMNSGPTTDELPPGYSFDYINSEVIRRDLQVKDGRFVLPGGLEYRLLVLPPQDSMRPELLRKISELVRAGGAILGAPPQRSPSLQNFPQCDLEVRQLASDLWKGPIPNQGRVFDRSTKIADALETLNVQPDLGGIGKRAVFGESAAGSVSWSHRRAAGVDVYYLSNQSDEQISQEFSFRTTGKAPQLWDPVTSEMLMLPEFKQTADRTSLPLVFTPRQAYFIVFGSSEISERQKQNFPPFRTVQELDGPWKVDFDQKLGGVGSTNFESLIDWSTHSESGIKYYSGTAVYHQTFDCSPLPGQRMYLNLGKVADLASVRLNGQLLRTLWSEPARVEITDLIRSTGNILDIEVTNTWNNRLVHDHKLPVAERMTSLTFDWTPGMPLALLPAGLLGPVTVETR